MCRDTARGRAFRRRRRRTRNLHPSRRPSLGLRASPGTATRFGFANSPSLTPTFRVSSGEFQTSRLASRPSRLKRLSMTPETLSKTSTPTSSKTAVFEDASSFDASASPRDALALARVRGALARARRRERPAGVRAEPGAGERTAGTAGSRRREDERLFGTERRVGRGERRAARTLRGGRSRGRAAIASIASRRTYGRIASGASRMSPERTSPDHGVDRVGVGDVRGGGQFEEGTSTCSIASLAPVAPLHARSARHACLALLFFPSRLFRRFSARTVPFSSRRVRRRAPSRPRGRTKKRRRTDRSVSSRTSSYRGTRFRHRGRGRFKARPSTNA